MCVYVTNQTKNVYYRITNRRFVLLYIIYHIIEQVLNYYTKVRLFIVRP